MPKIHRYLTYTITGTIAGAAIMAAGLWTVPIAHGQEDNSDRLQNVEQELKEAISSEAEKITERETLLSEVESLRGQLIDTASRMRAQEEALRKSETQQALLEAREKDITAKLDVQRAELATFLSALQSLQRKRPPALLVNPDDSAKAVRSAILLNDIIPRINAKAEVISGELENLKWVRLSIVEEVKRISLVEEALRADRARIESLITEKEERERRLVTSLDEERAHIARLAEEAESLTMLIAQLNANGIEETISLASLGAVAPAGLRGSTASALRFSEALGQLQLPVSGDIVATFGDDKGVGRQNQGLQIATVSNAQVITPFDGQIVYAGPFLDHEQLLLIEAGEGYHILISGMTRIYGQVGDRLLAGEPVGMMGPEQPQNTESGKVLTPVLYLEFRKDGDPINPLPWLASQNGKVNG